ncbi:MAG: alkaline phosphatase family protein [Opitutae bacterium]|nr:alkaline phosphatase family protein [Opitutae bacterium]
MRRLLAGLLALGLTAGTRAQIGAPVVKPVPPPIAGIGRVLIIGIDGLRPDRLLLANTPVIRGLMKQGAYSMWMLTVASGNTLPSFTSMLTGVSPAKHGITWNKLLKLQAPEWPARPTLFEMAHQGGYKTAMVAGKSKFRHLDKPGTIDFVSVPAEDRATDQQVVVEAVRLITEMKPDVLFVHLPGVDAAGHAKGWGSPEQLAAIEEADACVGRLLAALETAGTRASTLIMLSSDHGGAGLSHGADDPRSRTIPWIIAGPGVKRGCDLTQVRELVLRIEDTCATACYVLGLPVLPYFDGAPVLPAFENPPAP